MLKSDSKICMKMQKAKNREDSLDEEQLSRLFPDSKSRLIKAMWYRCKDN